MCILQVDVAFFWLRHCQRINLMASEPATVIGSKLAIGRQFLQLYMSRRADLALLGAPTLLHIMQAYARASAHVSHGSYGPIFASSYGQQPVTPTVEEEATRIDMRVSGAFLTTYFTDH